MVEQPKKVLEYEYSEHFASLSRGFLHEVQELVGLGFVLGVIKSGNYLFEL
jgi:hypothetical protein